MLHNTDDISRHRLPPDTSTIHITNTTFYLTCYIACVLRRINTVSQSVEPTYLRHPAIRWKRLVPATARRWPWVRRGTPEHLRQRPSWPAVGSGGRRCCDRWGTVPLTCGRPPTASSRAPASTTRQSASIIIGKGKGSPYSITERRVLEMIPVLGSQPAGDVSHKPGGSTVITFRQARRYPRTQTLRGLLPISLLGEQRHDDANSLPKRLRQRQRQRRDWDLNPGSTAPESSTLTTRLPSHPYSAH